MNESSELPQYSKVRILTSRFLDTDAVSSGVVGYVIEVHHDGQGPAYEVEVMGPDGRTQALVVARAPELELLH